MLSGRADSALSAAGEDSGERSVNERYERAWRDRKRRMVVFKTTQIAGIGVIFGVLFWMWRESSVSNPPALRPLLLIPVWYLTYIIAGIWLNRFHCPRCGRLFYWRVQLKGALERQRRWRQCCYCGLLQDTDPEYPSWKKAPDDGSAPVPSAQELLEAQAVTSKTPEE